MAGESTGLLLRTCSSSGGSCSVDLAAAAVRGGGHCSCAAHRRPIACPCRDLLKKVGSTVSKTVDAIVSSDKREREPLARRERRREEVEYPPTGGSLLGSLVGRAVGGMVGGMLREVSAGQQSVPRCAAESTLHTACRELCPAGAQVGKMAAQAAQQAADVQSRAAAIIETSQQVRERLGEVRVGQPFSQSSAASSINGRMTRRVTLLLPVDSSRGRATAEVSFVEGDATSGGGSDFNIRLRLPSGQVLTVDNASTSYAGKTIDAEWRSID